MTEHDRKNIYERRRNIIYLVAEYLKETGLQRTHTSLIDEAQLSGEFTVCDNVDLETMYLEFCSYFHIKFGKKPRFVKKCDSESKTISSSSMCSMETNRGRQALAKRRSSLRTAPQISTISPEIPIKDFESNQYLKISSMSPPSTKEESIEKIVQISIPNIFKKSMKDFFNGHPAEWKDMSETIFKDVIKKDLCVKWEDICGQDAAKMIIQESAIFPMKYPQLFNRVKPWKAVLLHGVPGCGKTMLARALCSETHDSFTFFNITSSCLISKWRGESEKLIRVLFELARYHAPSIIFIDELDSLTSKRMSGEHEASKRLKNEFLSLLDGLETDDCDKVFVLGATNMPWDIDQAFLRRFERKILIDVPSLHERENLIRTFLPVTQYWRNEDVEELAILSENFTGDDIRVAVKEANMTIIRKKISNEQIDGLSSFNDFDVEFHHLKDSLKQIKPNTENEIIKHRKWNSSFAKS